MRSLLHGGCDFAADDSRLDWTPQALPTVVGVVETPPALAGRQRRFDIAGSAATSELRVEVVGPGLADAVLLPLDPLFPIRVAAALRLWRALARRGQGVDPQRLPRPRHARLVVALRVLDARKARASYREIAESLFGPIQLRGDADWNSHDLRDRTVRLARTGQALMEGGYRRLLLYPYRRLN